MEHFVVNETADLLISKWKRERPNAIALRSTDQEITYSMLDLQTAGLIRFLQAEGLNKGDRIGWLGKNSLDYARLLFACARIGVVMVPIGWRLAMPEATWIARDAGLKVLVLDTDFAAARPAFEAALGSLSIKNVCDIALFMGMPHAGISKQIMDYTAADPSDPVLQLYTSGTTGHPKGVILSNRNLFGLAACAQERSFAYHNITPDEVILVAMPCAHIGGTGLLTMSLEAGVTGHVLPEFEPGAVLDAIQLYGITRLFLVPAALHLLTQDPRCRETDLSRLKYILYGASPMPLELLKRCLQIFQCGFIQAYGMTETTGTIVMLPPEDHDPNGNQRMRSAGKPLPGVEIKIVDGDGNELPVGEVGEVITRSSNNMLGYWNLPDATQKTLTGDGWVHTGDAGYVDEDGYLYIHDRVKDMIISGGENVYPAEVESAIYGHPDVLEVAVIGVPDDKWGEAVKAVCVPKPGATIDPENVITWARERIAGFKVPKSIDIIEALPRNASGKILRKDLRAPYWAGRDRQVN